MHYTYALCMSAQLLVMSDHSFAWSDIVSDHAKRIIMHTVAPTQDKQVTLVICYPIVPSMKQSLSPH